MYYHINKACDKKIKTTRYVYLQLRGILSSVLK